MSRQYQHRLVLRSLALLFAIAIRRTSATSTPKKTKVTLLTFDVDGTLIQGSSTSAEISVHARAFAHGVGSVFAKDPKTFLEKYPFPLSCIPPENYHGSTDGLIALHFAKDGCGVPPCDAYPKLSIAFQKMFEYMAAVPDSDVRRGIEPLPGVIDTLHRLRALPYFNENVLCGLVTGNVEGIARKKMRACGILDVGFLSRAAAEQQQQQWAGEENFAFLGGFGSDFCSGDIEDRTRVYKDRGEQIAIAFRRAQSLLRDDQEIVRVVHVGDAPGDVLAAKYCSEEGNLGEGVCVGCIAVATGKFSAEQLGDLLGREVPQKWEPIVLPKGIADPSFIDCCKIQT